MNKLKYTFQAILLLAISFGLYVLGVIIYGTVTEYHFEDEIVLSKEDDSIVVSSDSTFEFLIWNIGFLGLGEESDFFYDGGKDVFQSEETILKNKEGVMSLLESQSNVDFILLQEVDSSAWRSNQINLVEELRDADEKAQYDFALNFASNFVPIPIVNPMGPTFGGLLSISKPFVKESVRYDLHTESMWPKRMFFLKRCFLTQRIQLQENELVVVNIHNSAYDKSGVKRNKEMQQLLDFVEAECAKGNYVVVGGDWNQSPPNYVPSKMPKKHLNEIFTEEDAPEGWQWVADTTVPTNRKLDKPYVKGDSYTSVIDHYLISPNLQVDSVAVIDLDFAYSDHQPVYLKVSIGR
jgi:endonuclease/exonuclease/phosphatase family metal-dependent hydrolase